MFVWRLCVVFMRCVCGACEVFVWCLYEVFV